MSWSTTIQAATIEEAREATTKNLDAAAEHYAAYGTPDGDAEAQDCRDAKRIMLARLDALDLSPNTLAPKGFKASVHGWGSRSTDGTVSFSANVSKVVIE